MSHTPCHTVACRIYAEHTARTGRPDECIPGCEQKLLSNIADALAECDEVDAMTNDETPQIVAIKPKRERLIHPFTCGECGPSGSMCRLHRAAPALLAALKAIMEWYTPARGFRHFDSDTIEQARAAIRAAEHQP